MARVLIPLPDRDFDPTEVAVPWARLRAAGHEVVFATPEGAGPPMADPMVLVGPFFGTLGVREEGAARYLELVEDPAFHAPLAYSSIDPASFTGLVLPGGHAQGMKPYLESAVLQGKVAEIVSAGHPVASICHGMVLLARVKGPDGRPILAGRRATALPRWMELGVWALTAWRLGRYYRTYDQTVEAEVREALGPDGVFERGPLHNRYDRPFVVKDGDLVTARWPGDAEAFADAYVAMLAARQAG